jgi:acetyl esterase/lipase
VADAGPVDRADAGALSPAADAGRLEDGSVVEDGGPGGDAGACDDASGCVLETRFYGRFSRAQIEPLVEPGVAVDNGYGVWRLRFSTSGREARATLTVPHGVTPPDGGFHIAVNNPGTVGLDDPCAVGESIAGTALAGFFGARGLVGVAVDYPGLGTPGLHPYLVAEVEGRASLDAARATLAFLKTREISVASSGRVVIAGLSQGGHATLAAAFQRAAGYASELDVRAFAAAGPASVFLEHWRKAVAVEGPHLVYHAMIAHAFAKHYGHAGPPLWVDSLAPRIDSLMSTRCLLAVSGPTLQDELGTDPSGIFHKDFLAAFSAGTLSRYPAIETGFAENRVRPFRQTGAVRIYQGDADDVVPEPMTRELVDALRAGGVKLDYEVVPGGKHTDVAFSVLAKKQLRTEDVLKWLRSQLDR